MDGIQEESFTNLTEENDVSVQFSSEQVEEQEKIPDEITTSVDESVSDDESYAFVEFLEFDFTVDLKEFYKHYILETPDGLIQIFQSMTYGEMMISFLLLVLIVLYVMRWIYDVLF